MGTDIGAVFGREGCRQRMLDEYVELVEVIYHSPVVTQRYVKQLRGQLLPTQKNG